MRFDILSEAFFANPFPTFAAMRREAPCWYDPRLGAYVLTRHQDIARVLRDDHFSAERVSQFGRGAPEHVRDKLAVYTDELERWLLFRDRPAHTPLRRRLGAAFGVRQRPLIERSARAAVGKALATLRVTDEPDLVRDFAYPVPSEVLARILGIPTQDIELFKRWTVDIFALIGAGVADAEAVESGYRGVTELRDYVLELLRDRRARPRDDVLSNLARPAGDLGGAVVSDQDLVGLFMTMIVAGHETTTNVLANGLYGILSDPRARDWALTHGGIAEASVDELIRHDGSVFSLIRRARRDVTLSGTLVRAGECVFSMLCAGNRDPQVFPDPDRLDFERPRRPAHVGLGVGAHACMGAAMARSIVAISVTEFLRAWPKATVEPGCAWIRNMSIRGLSTLPVRLEAPAVRASRREAAAIAQPLPDLSENQPRRVAAVIRPSDTDAVREAVLATNRQDVPLYPISTGKNWGVGSSSPVSDGCVLLDLSGMNRVRQLDLERGVAVVEPGVTQGALADRLAGTPFLLNVTTSCRSTSLVGNALDKGQGALRMRVEDLLGLEVVLGNGAVIATGVLGPPGHSGLSERGAGPDATRLFCQSNFGVVTAAAIALVPRPERTSYAYANFAGTALPAVVDRMARLRRMHVIDRIFYFSEMKIEPGQRELPDFTLLGPLLGRRRVVGEALDVVREELAAVPGCKAVRTGDVSELVPDDPLYHRGRTFLGIPSCEPVRQRFGTTSCDLDSTSAHGWSVVQVLLPLEGDAAADALALLKAGSDACGLTVYPHLSSVSDRALNLMTMISFRRDAESIERMRVLRDRLRTELIERGFHASREGIDALRAAQAGAPRDEAWARLKTAFDPKGVIAPGRYV